MNIFKWKRMDPMQENWFSSWIREQFLFINTYTHIYSHNTPEGELVSGRPKFEFLPHIFRQLKSANLKRLCRMYVLIFFLDIIGIRETWSNFESIQNYPWIKIFSHLSRCYLCDNFVNMMTLCFQCIENRFRGRLHQVQFFSLRFPH